MLLRDVLRVLGLVHNLFLFSVHTNQPEVEDVQVSLAAFIYLHSE